MESSLSCRQAQKRQRARPAYELFVAASREVHFPSQTRARVPPEARSEAYWQNALVRYGCEDLHSRSETHSEAYWRHSALYATDVRIYTALL